MKLLLPFTLPLFLASVTTVFAQSTKKKELDSLRLALNQYSKTDTTYVQILLKLGRKQRVQSPHDAIPVFQEVIEISQHQGSAQTEIKATSDLAICYGMLDDYTNAILYFNRSLEIATTLNLPSEAAENYNGLGIVHKRMGDYSTSLSFYNKALKIYDSLKLQSGISSTSLNIGSLYGMLAEHDKAMEYFSKTLALAEQGKDSSQIANVQTNIARIYIDKTDYQKASTLLLQALRYYTNHDATDRKILVQANLGWCFYMLKEHDKARLYLMPALAEAKRHKIAQHTINISETLAKLFADEGKVTLSQQYAKDAYVLALSIGGLRLKSKVEELMSYVHEKSGDMKLALHHFKQYKILEDSIFNEDKAQAYKSHQVKMEVAQKDRQLEAQTLHLAYLNDQVALQNRWKWTLATASFLLLLAVALYYQKYRQRQVYASALEEKNTLISEQRAAIELANKKLEKQYTLRRDTDDTINYFASSLIGKNDVEEILRDITDNCIGKLGLTNCAIYLVDEARQVLVQKAISRHSLTTSEGFHYPNEIPLGDGLTGHVAQTGKPMLINDAQGRSLHDTRQGNSAELIVPLLYQEKVIGILDSQHTDKDFFQQLHLDALKTIASIAASKIAHVQAEEKANKAKLAQMEAEQIKQMDQMKSHFFANISHEFRTPLNLILGPLQLHRDNILPHHADMMVRNAQRLLRLVNQLLDLAKLEVGKLKLYEKTLDVNMFLRIQVAAFASLAESKDVSYEYHIPEHPLIARIDPDKLEKICYNLLANAIKFTPPNGTVSVTALPVSANLLQLTFKDTGIGISKEHRHKIFDRFYQVDNSQARSFEGTGIGLSLTKELTELMGGTIAVKSEPEKGSEFIVRLPLQLVDEPVDALPDTLSPATDVTPEASALEQSDDKPLILLVEDNIDLRNFITDSLRSFFNIIEAIHGEEGITMAIEKIPDLIITDVMMPKMDGVEFTHRVKNHQLTSHIPVIMLTARDDAETKKTGFRTGADQYVIKPFDVTELQIRMESLIRQRHQLREKFSKQIVLQPKDITVTTHDGKFIESALQLVEENISNPHFTVEDMQRDLGLSRMQLHRKLKALTDKSATEFIRDIRLERAAQLLTDPNKHVTEVAYEVGFNHLSYFAKCFKEKFGIQPSAFGDKNAFVPENP